MMPRTVDIFGKTWDVKRVAPDGGADAGQCSHSECELLISPKQSLDNQRDTLLHEIIHAIDIELQTGARERQVRLLATGILGVLRANPKVVAFLVA